MRPLIPVSKQAAPGVKRFRSFARRPPQLQQREEYRQEQQSEPEPLAHQSFQPSRQPGRTAAKASQHNNHRNQQPDKRKRLARISYSPRPSPAQPSPSLHHDILRRPICTETRALRRMLGRASCGITSFLRTSSGLLRHPATRFPETWWELISSHGGRPRKLSRSNQLSRR